MEEKLENFVNLLHRRQAPPEPPPAAPIVPPRAERAAAAPPPPVPELPAAADPSIGIPPSVCTPPIISQAQVEAEAEPGPEPALEPAPAPGDVSHRSGRLLVLAGILIVAIAGVAGFWLRENDTTSNGHISVSDKAPAAKTTAALPTAPPDNSAAIPPRPAQVAQKPDPDAPPMPVELSAEGTPPKAVPTSPAAPKAALSAPAAPAAPKQTAAHAPAAGPALSPGEAKSEETYQPLPDKPVATETKPVQTASLPPAASAKGGEPQWVRYSLPVAAPSGRPRIAIVIDDLGLDRKRSERAISLKGPVTLSFLAYASDLPQQAEEARKGGHELLVHVPMEPVSRAVDMGPNGLAASLGHDEVLRRLRWDLSRFDGYIGINNHMGSRFTSDPDSMATVIDELHARGLLFLDSRTIGNSAGVAIAEKIGVPTAGRDVFLDDEVSANAISARLAETETVARRHGSAIAIGHPHDQTLDALTVWLAGLQTRGFELVPLSAVVKERTAERNAAHQSG